VADMIQGGRPLMADRRGKMRRWRQRLARPVSNTLPGDQSVRARQFKP
jgi:hypothetical protein